MKDQTIEIFSTNIHHLYFIQILKFHTSETCTDFAKIHFYRSQVEPVIIWCVSTRKIRQRRKLCLSFFGCTCGAIFEEMNEIAYKTRVKNTMTYEGLMCHSELRNGLVGHKKLNYSFNSLLISYDDDFGLTNPNECKKS